MRYLLFVIGLMDLLSKLFLKITVLESLLSLVANIPIRFFSESFTHPILGVLMMAPILTHQKSKQWMHDNIVSRVMKRFVNVNWSEVRVALTVSFTLSVMVGIYGLFVSLFAEINKPAEWILMTLLLVGAFGKRWFAEGLPEEKKDTPMSLIKSIVDKLVATAYVRLNDSAFGNTTTVKRDDNSVRTRDERNDAMRRHTHNRESTKRNQKTWRD